MYEFSLALHLMTGETDRSHAGNTKLGLAPAALRFVTNRTICDRPVPYVIERPWKAKEDPAAIVSLACSAKSGIQSGDLGCEEFNE